MHPLSVECLGCGSPRVVARPEAAHVDAGECPRCSYVGWAPSAALSEPLRRRIREQPLERRTVLYPL